MSKNLLLIHGTWQNDKFWNEAIPEFESRGYTVHAPVLRHHELPLMEGAEKIAPLSLLDYTHDLICEDIRFTAIDYWSFHGSVNCPIGCRSNTTSRDSRGMPCACGRDIFILSQCD